MSDHATPIDRTAILARAASACAALLADPRPVVEHVILHAPVASHVTRVHAAGRLLGTVGDASPTGWHVAHAADGAEEPVRSRDAGVEWLIGRAQVRAGRAA